MAKTDVFIVFENEKPVKWGCFELDSTGNVNYLTSPYVPQPSDFEWKKTSWPDSKPIVALNRNRLFTAYLKKDQKIYQIPLVESSTGRKILQVQQLKYFDEDVIWTSVQTRANAFILENTNDSIEQWIAKYPLEKPIIAFPEMMVRESSLSAQNLFERLQVQKCDLVKEPQAQKLAHGHMEIWRDDNSKLNYRVNILDHEKTGIFDPKLDKNILIAIKNGKFEENFSSLRLSLSRLYLNLDSYSQKIILASIEKIWPLLEIDDTQQEVIDEICRALIEEDDLNTSVVTSSKIQENVKEFRPYLFISKILELYSLDTSAQIHVGDAQQFIRFLLASASNQTLSISPVDQSINVLCRKNHKISSLEALLYSCLNQDNPIFSKLFVKYLTSGLEKFSLDEVIEFQEQMKDFFVWIDEYPNQFNQICENFVKFYAEEKFSHISEFIPQLVRDLQQKCLQYQQTLLFKEFQKLMVMNTLDEEKLQNFFSLPFSQQDKLGYFLLIFEHFDEKELANSALVNKLFNECITDIPNFLVAIISLRSNFYPMLFKHMQEMEFKLSTQQFIEVFRRIKQLDSKLFLDFFGEDLLNSIQDEDELKIFLDAMQNDVLLAFIQQYPMRLSTLFSMNPSLWLSLCKKDDTGQLFTNILPYFKEHQINFYSLFTQLNDDLKKILVASDFEQLWFDSSIFEHKISILPYLNNEQTQQVCDKFDIENLNSIARSQIDDITLVKILDGQFSRISAGVNEQNLYEFLNKLDKRVLNYVIKHQSPWLAKNIQMPNQFIEMMNHLNSALFIKKQKQIIEQYFPTHQDFLKLIASAKNDKTRDGLIKHVKPSFQYQAYQDCIQALQDYQKTLNVRARSFFTIQSSNKNKIKHVIALLAVLKGEEVDYSSLKPENMQTLKSIYQKYQKTVFDGQSFEELLNPQNQKMKTLSPGSFGVS